MVLEEFHFFKKITRATSELIILSIIKEKGESYSYEIQQILQKRTTKNHQIQYNEMNLTIHICERLFEIAKNPNSKNKEAFQKLISKHKSSTTDLMLEEFIKKGGKDAEVIKKLEELLENTRTMLNKKSTEIKIWNSITAIYQVMNDLEKRKLIKISKSEIFKGRTRKIYQMTKKGNEEVFRMLTIFNDLNQIIIPSTKIFFDNFDALFQDHLLSLVELLETLFPDNDFIEIVRNIGISFPQFEESIGHLFPLINNDSLLLQLVQKEINIMELINIKSVPLNLERLFKHILLERLKTYRNKFDNAIKNMEEEI